MGCVSGKGIKTEADSHKAIYGSSCQSYGRIEYFFEAVEANIGYALFAGVASFTMTGCLRLLWE